MDDFWDTCVLDITVILTVLPWTPYDSFNNIHIINNINNVSKKMLGYDFFLSVYIVQRVGGRETLRAELLLVHIIISLYCIPVFYYHKFSLNQYNSTFREVHCLIQLIKELLTMFHYTFIDMGWGQGVWRNRKEK